MLSPAAWRRRHNKKLWSGQSLAKQLTPTSSWPPQAADPHTEQLSNKRCLTSLDLKAKVMRHSDRWQVSSKSTDSLDDCLLSIWSNSRSAVPTDSHTNPPPQLTSGGNDKLANNSRFKSGPPLTLMRGLWVHKNSLISNTKLSLDLLVGFISSNLAADKLFEGNSRAIAGPPKMSLLLAVRSMPALVIKPMFIRVAHMDDFGWYLKQNQQGQMLVQNLHKIVSRPNVTPGQILHCITRGVAINFVFLEMCQNNTRLEQPVISKWLLTDDWSELPIGATTATLARSGTSVSRRPMAPPRTCMGQANN